MRTQRALAWMGICSRRKAEDLIRQGRVAVNGRVVDHLGHTVEPGDVITVDGSIVRPASPRVYVALHKPKGYLSTTRDSRGRPTAIDLVKNLAGSPRLFPAGRLDLDSEGLLILTNDGELANVVMHPRYGIRKRYRVWVKGIPGREDLESATRGVRHDESTLRIDTARVIASWKGGSVIEAETHEGKKREIRRIFAALGHPVTRLLRLSVGPVNLGSLPPGGWRHLTEEEVKALHDAAGGSKGGEGE